MTGTDFIALLPLLITAYGAVILTVLLAFWRSANAAFILTIVTLAAAFGSIFAALPHIPRVVTPLLRIDTFSLYFSGLVLFAAFFITLYCRDYFKSHEKRTEAFYLLVLMAVLGMIALASTVHFVSFFLSLEVLSVSLYGLIGYTRRFRPSLEASMKYLILAASSSAFLIFGIALVYAEQGTMDFIKLAPLFSGGSLSLMSYFGIGLIIVGFAYKLAMVPFHMWSPDVYQGAPAPVTALIASGSKGATFALLLRLFTIGNLHLHHITFLIIAVLAVATMFGGNLLALLQNNLKRLLAYSSVAQIGYMLIPLLAGGVRGPSSIAFYLASYFFATLTAFGVVTILSNNREMGDMEKLEDYRGLGLKKPFLAAVLSISLISLTGLPLTSGFFGKFYIFSAAASSGLWWLLIIGIINSGISAYYYLRVIYTVYLRPEAEPGVEPLVLPRTSPVSAISLTISSAALIFFGFYPGPLVQLAQSAMRTIKF